MQPFPRCKTSGRSDFCCATKQILIIIKAKHLRLGALQVAKFAFGIHIVSALECGHSYYTSSGNVSEHSSGNAVDIAAINGIPIVGHQGPGSITDMTIRRLLTLQGTMKPHQIISLMTFDGADNTLALPDHADHIHVGFRPLYGDNQKLGKQLDSVLKPGQWIKLIDRIGAIDNPTVLTQPSKYAIRVAAPKRASIAHVGE